MNKTVLALGIIFLLVGMSFTSISGNQINNQVNKPSSRGDILYVGGSGPGNYTTIQGAINAAKPDDTIFVFNGTYFENINIFKSITLIGENKDITIIDGGGIGVPIKITNSFVKISSFTIQNSIPREDGIQVINENNIDISDCNIFNSIGSDSSGIGFEEVLNSIIRDCYFNNNSDTVVVLLKCENIEIYLSDCSNYK